MRRTLCQVKAIASNIVNSSNSVVYTIDMFLADFPQFSKTVEEDDGNGTTIKKTVSLIPDTILQNFIDMAADAIQEGRWFKKWRYATGLYIAHYATLYLQTYQALSPDNSISEVVSNSKSIGNVASETFGDQSVSFDNSSNTDLGNRWGAWVDTVYGKQLVTEAKLLGIGGTYAI